MAELLRNRDQGRGNYLGRCGADNDWSTPENWSTDNVPTAFDDVVFDATSSEDCVLQQDRGLRHFSMLSGYGGVLSFSGPLVFLTVDGDYFQQDGTITLPGQSKFIIVSGDVLVEGGILDLGCAQ